MPRKTRSTRRYDPRAISTQITNDIMGTAIYFEIAKQFKSRGDADELRNHDAAIGDEQARASQTPSSAARTPRG